MGDKKIQFLLFMMCFVLGSAWPFASVFAVSDFAHFPGLLDMVDLDYLGEILVGLGQAEEQVTFAVICKDVANDKTIGKFLIKGDKMSLIPLETLYQKILGGDSKGRLKGYKLSPGNAPSFQAVDGKNYPMYFVRGAEPTSPTSETTPTTTASETTTTPEPTDPPKPPETTPAKATVTSYFQCKDEADSRVLETIPIYGDPGEYVSISVLITLTSKFSIPGYELSGGNPSGFNLKPDAVFSLLYRALPIAPTEHGTDHEKEEKSMTETSEDGKDIPEEEGEKREWEKEAREKAEGKHKDGDKQPSWYFDEEEEDEQHPLLMAWQTSLCPVKKEQEGSFDCVDPGKEDLKKYQLAEDRPDYVLPEAVKVELKEETSSSPENWDESCDVLVDGLTVSGLAAAISAEESHASVLVVDPSSEEDCGGYFRRSQQVVLVASDAEEAEAELKKLADLAGEKLGDGAKTYAEALLDLPYWLKDHGAETLYEFPEPAVVQGKGLKKLLLKQGSTYRADVIRSLLNHIFREEAEIELRCECRIQKLILHPDSGRVLGAELEKDGKTLRVQIRKGLILASEGFENNPDLLRRFFGKKYPRSKFALQHDGHAIELALKAGAALERMNVSSGDEIHFAALAEEEAPDYRMPLQGVQMNGRSAIFVDKTGVRFTNETVIPLGGYVKCPDRLIQQQIPRRCFAILDAAALAKGPLYPGWSQGHEEEIRAGYFFRADSLEELESLLKMEKGALTATLQKYQKSCEEKEDPDFGRDPAFLIPFSMEGPWYAMPLVAVMPHTLGGPRRSEACQVLTKDGTPIPGLYAVGSLGSAMPCLAPLGADMAEALITGRIAGIRAAENP